MAWPPPLGSVALVAHVLYDALLARAVARDAHKPTLRTMPLGAVTLAASAAAHARGDFWPLAVVASLVRATLLALSHNVTEKVFRKGRNIRPSEAIA